MAEGHVVRYNAERFHAALAGKPLVRAFWRSRRVVGVVPEDLVGRQVRRVEFAAKNHLFVLDDGATFRVHLMMFGSTQLSAPGAAFRKPEVRVRFLLETADQRVAMFSAPVVEYYPPGVAVPALATLGPDALKQPFDDAEFRRRFLASEHATVSEALLDPAVVGGVGNVYKSEILWQAGVDPRRAPGDLTDAEVRRLLRLTPLVMLEAYEALRDHEPMHQHRRVYRRSGQPCLRCATTLRLAEVGGRRTFWCPRCQPPAPGAPAPRPSTAAPPMRAPRPEARTKGRAPRKRSARAAPASPGRPSSAATRGAAAGPSPRTRARRAGSAPRVRRGQA